MVIYSITNKVNNKKYVGKTTKTISERFNSHINSSNSKSQTHLHRAIRKYGSENFIIEIVEDGIHDEHLLNQREVFWIKTIKSEYNMTAGGEGSSGRIFTEETRNKMSIRAKQRIRKPHSEETKRKIAESNSGTIFSEERKKKISDSNKGRDPWNKGKKFT